MPYQIVGLAVRELDALPQTSGLVLVLDALPTESIVMEQDAKHAPRGPVAMVQVVAPARHALDVQFFRSH